MSREDRIAHTPGPWSVYWSRHAHSSIQWPGIDADGERISLVIWGGLESECGIRGRTRDEANANALLIAAAPDLYKSLCEALDYMPDRTSYERAVRERAYAALAKAEGQVNA